MNKKGRGRKKKKGKKRGKSGKRLEKGGGGITPALPAFKSINSFKNSIKTRPA